LNWSIRRTEGSGGSIKREAFDISTDSTMVIVQELATLKTPEEGENMAYE